MCRCYNLHNLIKRDFFSNIVKITKLSETITMEEFRFFLKSSFLRTCFQYVQFSYFLYKFIPNTYASDIPPFPIGILGE